MLHNRKGKKEVGPTSTIVLLVLLAGFLLFILSIPEADRQEVLGVVGADLEPELLFSASPGEVFLGSKAKTTEQFELPNFELNGVVGSNDEVLDSLLILKSSVFSEDSKSFVFTPEIDLDTVGLNLNFFIQSYSGPGKLTVLLNGATLYSATPTIGKQIRINLPPSSLVDGINTLDFSMSHDGFNMFKSTSVTLSDVLVRTDSYGNALDYEYTFSLEENVKVNSAEFAALVRNSGSDRIGLEIEVNGNQLYDGVPSGSMLLDIPNSVLHSGLNKIIFSIEKGVSYELTFPTITVKTSDLGDALTYYFMISNSESSRIRDRRVSCDLKIIESQGKVDTVAVSLNSFVEEYNLASGSAEGDVCNKLVYGRNTLALSAEDSLELERVSITLTGSS